MQKYTLPLLLLLAITFTCNAQPLSIPSSPHPLSDTTTVKINVDGSSYFYNYEYFKPFAKGYTQPGFSLIPTVEANFGSKLVLGAGVHLSKYWGTSPFSKYDPVIYARYELLKNFFVQVGTLECRDGHQLSTILFNPLYKIDFRQENGMQFRYYGNRIFFDTWVNWEHYLVEGADDQEKLTAGFSGNVQVTPKESNFEILIPVQAVFKHIGGQINDKSDTTKKVRTLSNLSIGIQAAYKLSSNGKVGFLFQPIKFNDSYDRIPQSANGSKYGISSVLFVKTSGINVQLGYLRAKNFYTILGEEIYNNMTFSYDSLTKARNLYSATFTYDKEVYPGINFRFDTGAFYDPSFSDIDYYYGLGVIFKFDAWRKKIHFQ